MLKTFILTLTIYFTHLLGVSANEQQQNNPIENSELQKYYLDSFKNFKFPDSNQIHNSGVNLKVDIDAGDMLWKAILVVMMQKAPITYFSQKKGLLIAPPYALLIENKIQPIIYLHFMDYLYRDKTTPSKFVVKIDVEDRNLVLNQILLQISIQTEAINTFSSKKRWGLLYKEHQ